MAPTPALTPTADSLATRVAAFVRDEVEPNSLAMSRGEGPAAPDVLAAAARYDLAGVLIPREYGGGGASHREFAAVIEAVARACASTSVFLDVHLSVACEGIIHFGTDAQKRRYLPLLASGTALGAFCLTEPHSGSDAGALQTRAERDGDGYRITGTKAFISSGGVAGLYIVMARTGEGTRGITAFIVEAGAPGMSAGRPLQKMGLHGSRTSEMHFDGTQVATTARLGDEGAGFGIAMAGLDSGRIGISAQAVGIAQACIDIIVAAARDHPVDETLLADIEARTVAARLLTGVAADMLDAAQPLTRLASVTKLYATDTAVAAAHAAVELCAPGSADEDHPAAIRFRDAKAAQIYEGTNQIQRLVIARELLRAY